MTKKQLDRAIAHNRRELKSDGWIFDRLAQLPGGIAADSLTSLHGEMNSRRMLLETLEAMKAPKRRKR